jgi:chromosome segregation ATPase
VETGRDVDEFAAMVELAGKRREWRLTADKGNPARAKLDKARATADRERAQFEAIQAAWFQRAGEIDAEAHAAESVVARADTARAELVAPRNVFEPLRTRLQEAHAGVEEAQRVVADIKRELHKYREVVKREEGFRDYKSGLNKVNEHGAPEDHARRAASASRRVAEYEAQLTVANDELAAAQKELTAAEAAALKL